MAFGADQYLKAFVYIFGRDFPKVTEAYITV